MVLIERHAAQVLLEIPRIFAKIVQKPNAGPCCPETNFFGHPSGRQRYGEQMILAWLTPAAIRQVGQKVPVLRPGKVVHSLPRKS
jgi:hypothetical protein